MTQKNEALARLQRQLHELEKVPRARNAPGDIFEKWRRAARVAVERTFGEDSKNAKTFSNINYYPFIVTQSTTDDDRQHFYEIGLNHAKSLLESFIAEVQEYWADDQPSVGSSNVAPVPLLLHNVSPISLLETICARFHLVARLLAQSGAAAVPQFTIQNEYGVQRLLHSLLVLHFDDIRPEESSPSHAGAATRVDFLLKREQILIEVKWARDGLTAKVLGEQLMIDVQRYSAHPDCKTLVCFVYDPEGRIPNPRGIENDLSGEHRQVTVQVIIAPRFAM
jgi:hypothetical protein